MSSIHFPPSSSSSGLATSQSCPLPCFSRFLYALCLCPNLHPPSLPLAIFLHLELSLSCLFSISRPSVNPSGTPSLSYLSFSSGLSISPRFTCSCPSSSFSLPLPASLPLNLARPRHSFSFSFSFSSGLYFCAPDVLPVANIVFLPPPLDMAKEAICALLAILEHFFEAFSPLDLFFAPSPFRPAPRPFPAFLHPGCRRFRPLRLPSLSLAPLPHQSPLAASCARRPPSAPASPVSSVSPASSAPCAPDPFLRTRASEKHRGE